MKKIIISSLLIVLSIFASAQNSNDEYYNSSLKPKLISTDRVNASVMAGTSVSFSNKYNSVSTFIAPKVNYQITERFRLNIGLIHYTSYPNSLLQNKNENTVATNKKNYSSDLVFIGGEYALNNKVTISGAVMTNTSSLNNKQNNYKAAAIGLDYKVSKHSSIGIQAGISQGSQDYMFNPKKNTFDYYPSTDRTNGLFTGLGQWGVEALNSSLR